MVEEGVLDFGLVRREGAWPGDGEEAALPFGMVSGNGGTRGYVGFTWMSYVGFSTG